MAHIARKRFGQNFLHDPGVISRIVSVINPKTGENLVEIGPGQGAISEGLLATCGKLHAIELDRDLLEPLKTKLNPLGEFHLHNADALDFSFCSLAEKGNPLRLVGNLPYNISTPILFHLLDQARCIQDMHFMLQKEVVERMAAPPGSKTYGRLSVMIQLRCRVEPLFDIGPGAFNPPPKVDSTVVRLVPLAKPPFAIDDTKALDQIVVQAFSLRRKTLRNSLKKLLTEEQITACQIDPAARPETLSLEAFVRLANTLHALKTG